MIRPTQKTGRIGKAADIVSSLSHLSSLLTNIDSFFSRKVFVTFLYGMTTMCSTFASSVYSPALTYVAAEYGISQEVAILGISLFVLGYVPGMCTSKCVNKLSELSLHRSGPVLFAPLSELYGRKISIIIPIFIFACFSIGQSHMKGGRETS